MSPDGVIYRAFISYSHADKACAQWLHRALEGYRIPAKLVGTTTPVGSVPARLAPIFRDREELPASGDLSAELQAALAGSLFLIVIVSPHAAASKWVNEEIRRFKMMHGEGRVLALIAGDVAPGAVAAACFPPALRYRVAADGTLTDVLAEPIAADIRPGHDGRKLAKLKLVAGLTGLRLDALVQRDAVRRARRLGIFAALAGVLALVMTVLAVLALRARAEADRQRAQSDGLVEYMLTDLRKKLEPVGRLEILDSVGQQAMGYYGAQQLADLDADALGRRARALHLVGEVRDLRGDSAGALKAFTEAATSTAELLARAPADPDQMFDHAQSVYWVGYIAYQRKDVQTAEARYREYDRLAAAMVASDAANPKWQQEAAYAHNNLGMLYLETLRYDEAADRFRRGQAIEGRLAARAPDETQHQWLLAQGHALIAKSLFGAARIGAALDENARELAIYDRVLARDPRHARARESRAVALTYRARFALLQGRARDAAADASAAFELIAALAATDRANRSWQETALLVANQRTEALMAAQLWPQAAASNRWALAKAAELVALDPTVADWRRSGLMPARWMAIAIAHAQDDHATARAGSQRFRQDFSGDRGYEPAGLSSWAMVLAMAGLDARAQGDDAAAAGYFAAARAALPAVRSGRDRAMAGWIDAQTDAARRDAGGDAGGDGASNDASEIRFDPQLVLAAADRGGVRRSA